MKKFGTILSIFAILGLWQLAAISIHNNFLMPYPLDVVSTMMEQCTNHSFYNIVFHTLYRSIIGLALSFFIASSFAFLASFFPFFKHILAPIMLLTKSIPNISYIIIILVWFGSESSSVIIPFLILFPVMYSNLYEGIQSMDQDLQDVLRVYPEKRWMILYKIYLPMLFPIINATISSGLGLAFKVGVMAEIIGQVQIGIGRQLNVARFNMDMTSIFAWTIWIILLLMIFDFLRKYAMRRMQK